MNNDGVVNAGLRMERIGGGAIGTGRMLRLVPLASKDFNLQTTKQSLARDERLADELEKRGWPNQPRFLFIRTHR